MFCFSNIDLDKCFPNCRTPFLNEKKGKNLKSDMSQRKREEFPVVPNFKQYKLAEITWMNYYMPILQAYDLDWQEKSNAPVNTQP